MRAPRRCAERAQRVALKQNGRQPRRFTPASIRNDPGERFRRHCPIGRLTPFVEGAGFIVKGEIGGCGLSALPGRLWARASCGRRAPRGRQRESLRSPESAGALAARQSGLRLYRATAIRKRASIPLVGDDSHVSRDDRGQSGSGCANERASPVRHNGSEAGKPVAVERRELGAKIVDDERRERLGAPPAPVMLAYHVGLRIKGLLRCNNRWDAGLGFQCRKTLYNKLASAGAIFASLRAAWPWTPTQGSAMIFRWMSPFSTARASSSSVRPAA